MELSILLACWMLGIGSSALGSLLYLRWGRLERPSIGVFGGGDLLLLLGAVVALPFLYVSLPGFVLSALLLLGLLPSLYSGLRPFLSARLAGGCLLLLVAALLLSAARPELSSLHEALGDLLVVGAAVVIANLYAQGGLRMRPLSWGVLILGAIDAAFTWLIPITPALFAHFAQAAIPPFFSLSVAGWRATIGLGDLLVYGTCVAVAAKSYGARGAVLIGALVALLGLALPVGVMWMAWRHGQVGTLLLPLQAFFAPAPLLARLLLGRHERSVRQWRQETEATRGKLVQHP